MKKQFLVALHVTSSLDHALEEAGKILTPDGAHGLILVNHDELPSPYPDRNSPTIYNFAQEIKRSFPDYIVGVNPLGIKAAMAMDFAPPDIDILWTDHGGLTETSGTVTLPDQIARKISEFKPKYYGSIAFKYRPQPRNLIAVATEADKYFDAVITSGDKTGVPPSVDKMRTLRQAGLTKPIGIASGMSKDNVHLYMTYADIFIVATSLNIPGDFNGYDSEAVKRFRESIEAEVKV